MEKGKKLEFRDEVRLLRNRFGLSLDDLAAYANLSKTHLSLFERGERELSEDAKRRVLDALLYEVKRLEEREKQRLAEIQKRIKSFTDIYDAIERAKNSNTQRISVSSETMEHVAIGSV